MTIFIRRWRSPSYAILGSRPDLAHTVGVLGRFASEPRRVHMLAARRTLKYPKGTIDFGFLYQNAAVSQLHGFTNANWEI